MYLQPFGDIYCVHSVRSSDIDMYINDSKFVLRVYSGMHSKDIIKGNMEE